MHLSTAANPWAVSSELVPVSRLASRNVSFEEGEAPFSQDGRPRLLSWDSNHKVMR